MVYRHVLVTRITHATFFLSFLALAVSGAQMYFHQRWIPFKVPALHQYFGLAMLASGVIYIVSGIVNGQLGKLLFNERDVSRLWPMTAYYLRLRRTPPVYDAYNPLQKLAYTMVLFFIAPLIVASGFALWKHSPLQTPLQTFFGRKTAGIWHIGFAIELLLFFGGHMVMVGATGLRNNVRSIVTGWYRVECRPSPQTRAILETVATTAQSPQASPLRPGRRMPASR
jgi:thiosulfate reductase cytochrome b subunit